MGADNAGIAMGGVNNDGVVMSVGDAGVCEGDTSMTGVGVDVVGVADADMGCSGRRHRRG